MTRPSIAYDYEHGPTDESIAAAKQHQQAERAKVEREAGIRFLGDRIIHAPQQARVAMFEAERELVVIPCEAPGCLFVGAGTEQEAAAKVIAHWSKAHGVVMPRSVA